VRLFGKEPERTARSHGAARGLTRLPWEQKQRRFYIMKHMKFVTKKPASADDSTGTVTISVLMTFIIAFMTALQPVLAAKYPTTT